MGSDSESLRKEISAYLGEEKTKILDNFTEKDWKFYQGLHVDISKSYFVKGSLKKLKKFEAYYLFLSAYKKPLYRKYILSNYVSLLMNTSTNESETEDELGLTRELVILAIHDCAVGVGNAETLMTITTLNEIANRNRIGCRTLILSERTYQVFQDSPELEVIDLGGAIVPYGKAQVDEFIKNKDKWSKNKGDSNSNSNESSNQTTIDSRRDENSDWSTRMNNNY